MLFALQQAARNESREVRSELVYRTRFSRHEYVALIDMAPDGVQSNCQQQSKAALAAHEPASSRHGHHHRTCCHES